MLQIHCHEGDTLDRLYTQETLAWGVAETQKRAAVCVASTAERFEIARNAEVAKKAYEKAKCDYLDHALLSNATARSPRAAKKRSAVALSVLEPSRLRDR
jgi:hypothetical protein